MLLHHRTDLAASVVLYSIITFAITGCSPNSGPQPELPIQTSLPTTAPGPIPSSPYIAATQGVAVNGRTTAFVSSNDWLAAYNPDWSRRWLQQNAFAGMPNSVNHIGDVDFYDGKLIAPVASWKGTCTSFPPSMLAVFDASNGSLLTWSDISKDGANGSAVAIVPELNQVAVTSFCDNSDGFSTLWIYDLDTLLKNPPGSTLASTKTIHMSAKIPYIQGIGWNSNFKDFLISAMYQAPGGTLWYVGSDGTVSGPAYTVPVSQPIEMEGVDFATDTIYYLEGGIVANIGTPPSQPIFSVPPGSFASAQTVTISTESADVVIHYTTDSSLPNSRSPVYTAPIVVSASQTLKAIATNSLNVSSPTTVATYVIQ